jgi:hypothetical protein
MHVANGGFHEKPLWRCSPDYLDQSNSAEASSIWSSEEVCPSSDSGYVAVEIADEIEIHTGWKSTKNGM